MTRTACLAASIAALVGAPVPAAQTGSACDETSASTALVDSLATAGFESVGACVAGTRALVTYENRLFRYDVRALEAVAESASLALGTESVHVVPTRNGIPLIRHTVRGAGAGEAALATPPLPPPTNSPRFRLDVAVHPDVRAVLGDFGEPVRLDLAVSPAATLYLARGLSATTQVVIPLVARTETTSGRVRPGVLALHQEARLPFDTFARASVGAFTDDRYGVDVVSTTYLAGGRASATVRAGRTGFARFDGGRWTYSALDRTTYTVRGDYLVLPTYGFGIGGAFGRTLAGDPEWRAEVHRSFGEASVSLFGLLTGGEPNLGGRLALPLPVRRHPRPRRVRVRVADRFDIEYRYRRTAAPRAAYEATPVPWNPLGPLVPPLLPYHLDRRARP